MRGDMYVMDLRGTIETDVAHYAIGANPEDVQVQRIAFVHSLHCLCHMTPTRMDPRLQTVNPTTTHPLYNAHKLVF